ncbi:MAG: adenine nucleotide alpha hydrolase family protein [Deltaproteobacteria bacterium]
MKIVRHVGTKCRDPAYTAALAASDAAIIDTARDQGNVAVGFHRRGRRHGPLQMRWDPTTRDLFDLAGAIYVADELAGRGGDWARRFEFHVPVVDPAAWQATEGRLSHLLRFLIGDAFEFRWMTTGTLPGYGKHRVGLPVGEHDVVCLFSGGLDSLMGALRLLEEGKRVLLVAHHSDAVASAAQRDIFMQLQQRYGNRLDLVQCSWARSPRRRPRFALPQKAETSHRSRSFLFLALAIAVARGARIERVVLAENGLIALNPPLGRSRVGSLSTRTAHPRYLSGFLEFVRELGAFSGDLRNPFLYMSKTDIVDDLQPWQAPLVLRSVSCAHAATVVRYEGKSGVRHCGYCLPCIYRRVALISAGCDNARHYCDDVFRNLHGLSAARQEDMRFLVRFARRIERASRVELRSLVVSHGTFPAGVGRQIGPAEAADYGPWADMLTRWAGNFLERLEEKAATQTKRLLGLERTGRRAGAGPGRARRSP